MNTPSNSQPLNIHSITTSTIQIKHNPKHHHSPLTYSKTDKYKPFNKLYHVYCAILSTMYADRYMNLSRIKILAYFACYSDQGYYSANKGSRELLCTRLGMNKSTYQASLRELCRLRLLTKMKNSTGSQYSFYKLCEAVKEVVESGGKVTLSIEFS